MNIFKKLFDKHFNYDEDFIKSVAEKYNFNQY